MVAAAKSQETIEILWIWQIIFDTTTKEKLQIYFAGQKVFDYQCGRLSQAGLNAIRLAK